MGCAMGPVGYIRQQLGYCCVVVSLVWALGSFGWAQLAESRAILTARIERLIQQLDDDNFAVREKAEAELTTIGEPAREKLTAAAKDSAAERSRRAAKILDR